MLPPVFTTLQASADVRAVLGARPRVYRFGEVPENETRPYGVWQVISGVPENTLSESPAVDRATVQLDIYATTDAEAVAVATACRDQLETVTHMTAFRNHPRDGATRLFRIGMDFDFWLARES
jgi:hypothetical protein